MLEILTFATEALLLAFVILCTLYIVKLRNEVEEYKNNVEFLKLECKKVTCKFEEYEKKLESLTKQHAKKIEKAFFQGLTKGRKQ